MKLRPIHALAANALIAIAAALYYFLVPPAGPAQAQFTEQRAWGGTATGTANAQVVALANYALNVGVPIRYVASATNTSTTTLNINATGAVAVKRVTANVGVQDLVGGEIITGQIVTVIYDGTVYKLIAAPDRVGVSVDMRTTAVMAGHLIEDGSCVSRTAPATLGLFTAIGTTYGACDGSTTFALPDSRGRANFALDNQGGAGAANRITTAGGGCNLVSQIGCGLQTGALTSTNQLPPYTPAGGITPSSYTPTGSISPSSYTPAGSLSGSPGLSLSDTRTWTTVTTVFNNIGVGPFAPTGGGTNWGVGTTAVTVNGGSLSGSVNLAGGTFTGNAQGFSFTGNAQGFSFAGTPVGSSATFAAVPPALGTLRAIKL